jgi:hypothetical protein
MSSFFYKRLMCYVRALAFAALPTHSDAVGNIRKKIVFKKPILESKVDFCPGLPHPRESLALECVTLGFSMGYLWIPKETHRSP